MKFVMVLVVGVFIGVFVQIASVCAEDGLSVTGFVDTSYMATNSKTDITVFSLDQIEIDIEKKVDKVGSLHFDLNVAPLDDKLSGADIVEQGYITIDRFPVSVKLGKFNAPIGFELLDAPDMFQFSHAMIFDYGLPTNLTGISLSGEYGIFDYNLYYANNLWDLSGDLNKEKAIGTRLGFTPLKGVNFGISYVTSKEGPDLSLLVINDPKRVSIFDFDLTVTMLPKLTVGFEFNHGTSEEGVKAGEDGTWSGFLFMGHYDFSKNCGLTLRYDTFDDEDGFILDPIKEKRSSITIAPTFIIGDGFGALLEYRMTSSSEDVFVDKDGNKEDSESLLALEFTYSF